ncbi:related to Cell wall protein YJL171C [Saccharomycodes ludwigii]|uniref:glucan endo-1,3-beta-D-glucosidase n=1 Tax=Saccharomycodes ludwigii TaxID=36035 RepID=A0A376BAK3_9ASCO|nr:related to Cell wall protein YJL171C [Saccharomycodes ludwigii]
MEFLTLSLIISLILRFSTAEGLQKRDLSNPSVSEILFEGVGFTGYYSQIKKLVEDGSCDCEIGGSYYFSGPNSPLDEEVAVHFRGPLSLYKFAYYTSEYFDVSDNSTSKSWTRRAYYDSESATTENVTFLTKAGDNSTCLGQALTYASSDGVSKASSATPLGSGNLITSDEEYVIFSNISCSKSGYDKDCGVYRKGIPAYHGYYGTTKMFLFEFKAPTETQENSTSFSYYDMPAIWLLNSHIARTSQYPTNSNCSCWASGCGEFDIFEVMNGTQKNNFYSTFHTFQGTGVLGTGLQAFGHVDRDTEDTMLGGVIFDSVGNTLVFMNNETTFGSSIEVSDISALLNLEEEEEEDDVVVSSLSSISISYSTTSTAKSKNNGHSLFYREDVLSYYISIIILSLLNMLL